MKPDPHASSERPAPGRSPAAPGSTPPPDDKPAPAPAPGGLTFEQIRERAYELWERNHRPEGFEIEFWLLAERELRKEREHRKEAAPASSASEPSPRERPMTPGRATYAG